jgi:hypothetical protein
MANFDVAALRAAVRERRYRFTDHAAQRMGERRISRSEALAVIEIGELIEEHMENLPHPKALLMAVINGEPLYVSRAFDGRYAYIITVHWHDRHTWIDPRTRRRN